MKFSFFFTLMFAFCVGRFNFDVGNVTLHCYDLCVHIERALLPISVV